MIEDAPAALFLGELSDPWVAEIADAMPGKTVRLAHGSTPGEDELGSVEAAAVIVVHCAILGPREGEALRLLKERDGTAPPRLVLCIGPHVRSLDLERWAGVADVVLPEATASETIARHVGTWPRPRVARPAITVIGGAFECRRVLADMCLRAGYAATAYATWDDAPLAPLAIWDVPVLEDDWDRVLRDKSARREVVAILGFADRATVARARAAGATACLDNTCEPADLAFVLDRIATRLAMDPPHPVPPAPKTAMRVARPPAVADPGRNP
ncbi:MAG: hypothetical protein JWN86_762 [Planctomycetota bacterium]|nr:hypothetical protein [Planctomycetota bacterium]